MSASPSHFSFYTTFPPPAISSPPFLMSFPPDHYQPSAFFIKSIFCSNLIAVYFFGLSLSHCLPAQSCPPTHCMWHLRHLRFLRHCALFSIDEHCSSLHPALLITCSIAWLRITLTDSMARLTFCCPTLTKLICLFFLNLIETFLHL